MGEGGGWGWGGEGDGGDGKGCLTHECRYINPGGEQRSSLVRIDVILRSKRGCTLL